MSSFIYLHTLTEFVHVKVVKGYIMVKAVHTGHFSWGEGTVLYGANCADFNAFLVKRDSFRMDKLHQYHRFYHFPRG